MKQENGMQNNKFCKKECFTISLKYGIKKNF